MGGGSAQVNPPHQVSVADGLTALLGDAVTVTDGVEVRNRPVPARPGFVTDPETGEPGIHVRLYAADGDLLDDEHIRDTLVSGRLRRRLARAGHAGPARRAARPRPARSSSASSAGSWALARRRQSRTPSCCGR